MKKLILIILITIQTTHQKYIYPTTWTLKDTNESSQISSALKIKNGRCFWRLFKIDQQKLMLKFYDENSFWGSLMEIQILMENYNIEYGFQYENRSSNLKVFFSTEIQPYVIKKKSNQSSLKIDDNKTLTLTIKTSTLTLHLKQIPNKPLKDLFLMLSSLSKYLLLFYLVDKYQHNILKKHYYFSLLAWQTFIVLDRCSFRSEYQLIFSCFLFTIFGTVVICGFALINRVMVDDFVDHGRIFVDFCVFMGKTAVFIVLYHVQSLGMEGSILVMYSLLPLLQIVDHFNSQNHSKLTFNFKILQLLIITYNIANSSLIRIPIIFYIISFFLILLQFVIMIVQTKSSTLFMKKSVKLGQKVMEVQKEELHQIEQQVEK